MLDAITCVLRREDRPMRAREIYVAAERLLGERLLWKSVKGTLSNYSHGPTPRFARLSRGLYQLTNGD